MRLGAFVLGCLWVFGLFATAQATPEAAIQNVLEQQVIAWNHGDLKQFVSSYSQHCTIIGSTISETTRDQVLAHYQEKYPSPGARGKLAFSRLAVHLVDPRVAVVTGRWHLEREAAAGGNVGGVFSLVLELLDGRWQIALDHTS